MNRGIFISFEGIDGCGKSTQIRRLQMRIEAEGLPVIAMRDPGGTAVSEKIRQILLSTESVIDPVTELLLYEAARAQILAEKIRPSLAEGHVVLIDRFFDSTTAYQGYGRKIDLSLIHAANHIATQGLSPDRTYLIDISWDESQKRRIASQKDRMENEGRDFFEYVRQGYLALAEKESGRVLRLDGDQNIDRLSNLIYQDFLTLRDRTKSS
ncbi:dTMP kinase [bacterium]|nr:dTMP kinase [bacterium]